MSLTSGRQLLLSSAAAGSTQYQVSRSLRFNSADSAYLSKNFGSAGNRKTWTWSGWVKRSKPGNIDHLFNATGYALLYFYSDDKFTFDNGGASNLTTAQVFRDFSAWYHIVLAFDTTQATAANRTKLYVNGVEVTAFSTATYPALNTDYAINNNVTHQIARWSAEYANFYLANVEFIDGTALTPSSFAETDATTGQWVPKLYSGSYGTNGFKLTFADNSNNTASTLGADTSGNGNNWTPNNLSVTAGAGNDSLVDTPTSYGTDTGAGGEVRGNYATLNPLKTGDTTSFAQGNLFWRTTSNGPDRCVLATIGMSSGKWYWECYMDEGTATAVGIALDSVSLTTGGAGSNSYVYYSIGTYYNSGSSTGSPSSFTTGDLIGVAFDADTGKLWFAKNGTWQSSGDPGAGTNPAMTLTTGLTYFPLVGDSGGASQSQVTANFGQRAFAYTNNRSGFKALVDTNLTAPVVAKPNTVMDVKLYTGNGSTQTISGLGFSPDLVWIKRRDAANYYNELHDIVRGTGKALFSNSNDAESVRDTLTSFNSNGFTVSTQGGAHGGTNASGGTYVGWIWDAGATTVTNNSGSIPSQVRANPSAGCSITTFTGNGQNGSSFGHGLSATPEFFIIKSLGIGSWFVWHKSLPSNEYNLVLNNTSPQASLGAAYWYTLNSSILEMTSNAPFKSGPHVMYAWSSVNGLSSFGSFTGNGSTNGPMISTGHRSRWLMIKRTDSFGWWSIWDTARNTYNAANTNLWANASDQETTSSGTAYDVDFLANGFKLRTDHADRNASGGTYVYASFSEAPFKYARAR